MCNSDFCCRNSGGSGGEEESLSRSASDSSVSNPVCNNNKPSAPGTPLPSHGLVVVELCCQGCAFRVDLFMSNVYLCYF